MATSVIAAARARAEREIVDHFRRSGATRPDRAVEPPELGLAARRQLRRLTDALVLQEGEGGQGLWLDEAMYESYRSDRRTAKIVALVALLAIAAAVLLAKNA